MASTKKQRTPRSKITYIEVDRDFEDMENEMLKMRKDMTQMITRMRELRRKYRRCVQFKVEQKKRNSSESSDVNTKVSIIFVTAGSIRVSSLAACFHLNRTPDLPVYFA